MEGRLVRLVHSRGDHSLIVISKGRQLRLRRSCWLRRGLEAQLVVASPDCVPDASMGASCVVGNSIGIPDVSGVAPEASAVRCSRPNGVVVMDSPKETPNRRTQRIHCA